MYQSTGTQHAKQKALYFSLFPSQSVQLIYQSRLEANTVDIYHFELLFFFFIRKEQLQNFGKIVNQQLHLYKNTFVIFSVCQQSGTADPEHFFHTPNSLLEVEEKTWSSKLVFFCGMFFVCMFQWRL